jgi:hypothetical protein
MQMPSSQARARLEELMGRLVPESEVEYVLRKHRDWRPRVVAGRRVWTSLDVERVAGALREKGGRKPAPA